MAKFNEVSYKVVDNGEMTKVLPTYNDRNEK